MKRTDIEKLIHLLEKSSVAEIEITDLLGRRVRISKAAGATAFAGRGIEAPATIEGPTKPSAPRPEPPPSSTTAKGDTKKTSLISVRSPIVGTFYRAPAPDAPPYVEVGDVVKPGQVVCIVEAMKLMNEIEADAAGRIVEILVKNEEPVEYNQELFLIEPL